MYLPKNIIALIYSFDSTYHQVYQNVVKEFSTVNDFWGLKFHNQSVTETMSSNKMRSTQKQVNNLADYWNKDFINQSYLSINNYQQWYAKNGVCSPVHITDTNKWGKYWKILKVNIESYKFLNKKECV